MIAWCWFEKIFFYNAGNQVFSTNMYIVPVPVAPSGPLWGMEGHMFDPGQRHTKVVKNGTNFSSLGTETYRVELGLVNPVSG